jgi:hypothetical protein
MAFQKCLIDSHALFSPSKMDSRLKLELPTDQMLKGPIVRQTQKMNLACFVVLSLSSCDVLTSSPANRSVDQFGDGWMLRSEGVAGARFVRGVRGDARLLMTWCRVRVHIYGLLRLSSVHILMEAIRYFVESNKDQGHVWLLHYVLLVRRVSWIL